MGSLMTTLVSWGGFGVLVVALLALDLGVFHRKAHVVTLKESLVWSAVWIAVALLFNLGLYFWRGAEPALEFLTGYVPLCFVLMGIQVDLGSLANPTVLGFGVVLVLCAIAGKLACGLGVARRGMNRLAVAFGMVPRGEVGLIFAGIGTSLTLQGAPLLSQGVFSAVILMVLVSTLVAPVGLRWAFGDRTHGR